MLDARVFCTPGTAAPATLGKGFFIDNVRIAAYNVP